MVNSTMGHIRMITKKVTEFLIGQMENGTKEIGIREGSTE